MPLWGKERNWEFVGRADSQVVTNVVCFRSQPDPLGIVLRFGKLGICRAVRTCHSEPVRTTFVGISIVLQIACRHPFVGAVIDRPQKRAEFQYKSTEKGTFSPK